MFHGSPPSAAVPRLTTIIFQSSPLPKSEYTLCLVCESRVSTWKHLGFFNQFSLRLVPETPPQSARRSSRERSAQAIEGTKRRHGLRNRGAGDHARSRSFVPELPAHRRAERNHVSTERLNVADSQAEISASGAYGLTVDAQLLLLDGWQCFFGNRTPLHRKPENPLAIHPTTKAVGFLAGSCKYIFHPLTVTNRTAR